MGDGDHDEQAKPDVAEQAQAVLEAELFEKYGELIASLEKEGLTGKNLAKNRVEVMYKEISVLIEEAYDRL